MFERASCAFRRGYNDFWSRREFDKSLCPGTFAFYDYNEGYAAAFNEMYWDAVRENNRY